MNKYPKLYHGTDDRILSMSAEEREQFKKDCIMVSDYLWSLFKPYYETNIIVPINLPGYEGCTEMEKKLYEFKDLLDTDDYITMCYALDRQSARNNGNELYDYSYLYLSNDIERAKSYARRSFAFGEIGLTTFQLIDAEKKIKLAEFNPDEETMTAINKIYSFANEEAEPVVVELSDYDPDTIQLDNGHPIKWKFVNEHVTISLRCVADINLNELNKYYI